MRSLNFYRLLVRNIKFLVFKRDTVGKTSEQMAVQRNLTAMKYRPWRDRRSGSGWRSERSPSSQGVLGTGLPNPFAADTGPNLGVHSQRTPSNRREELSLIRPQPVPYRA